MNQAEAYYAQAKKILKYQSKSALINLYLQENYKCQLLEQELKKRIEAETLTESKEA